MTAEAQLPRGWRGLVQKMIDDSIARFARSGFLRNASVTGGAGLTVADGGAWRLTAADGTEIFYVGPVDPPMPDGSPQPGVIVRRGDGTVVLMLYDVDPTVFQQALNWYDRGGNVVLADDTASGQGLARPYIPGGFHRTRFADFTVTSTSATFETLWDARLPKQHPRLEVGYRASMDTAATTGEVRVLVNGVQLGATTAEAFLVATRFIGPAAVAGNHLDTLLVEIQGRRTSAGGALRVEPLYVRGVQS